MSLCWLCMKSWNFGEKKAFEILVFMHWCATKQNIKAVKLYKANTKNGLVTNKYSIEYFFK